MNTDYDLVILGSGFGGSLLGMIAKRLGLSVLLLERGTHPRFAIGESTSPLTNLLLEELALRYDLPRLIPFTTWGVWQKTYPEVGCGLKRGFTYYHHTAGEPFSRRADRSDQLMVAASPRDEIGDTHWLRADFDHFLVKEAVALGVDYQDETNATALTPLSSGGSLLEGERKGQPFKVRARLVIDATGPRGFLSRALPIQETTFSGCPITRSLFTHFTDVRRCETMEAFTAPSNGSEPPYAPDDAALHHVFDGGWMWVLRFNNGVTSAGFTADERLAAELNLSEGAPAWPRFLARFPSIGEQFAEAKPTRPFIYAPRLSYRAARAAGEGWAMLPSAAGFIDPLFSTGFPLTLLGIERLGRILESHWGKESLNPELLQYGATTLAELDWTAHFIGACYRAMPHFPTFTAFSMFYFAAASFNEIARRLDRKEIAKGFLAREHTEFARGLTEAAQEITPFWSIATPAQDACFAERITEHIAPLNIAGLSAPEKQNWYGVDLEDVIREAEKLNYTPEGLRTLLATVSWL